MAKWICFILVCGTALSGCAELTNSIYHNRQMGAGGPRIVTVDAKQRNVFALPFTANQTPAAGKDAVAGWRICAEASPDAFSALSASASADVDVTARKAKLAAAFAESAGTIERTQTINLLRESMYRTCERYLSGGINSETFVVQAARDQHAMIAVLAIEQLTRSVRAPSTVLSAGTTSASVVNGDTLAELIKTYGKERADADAALATAQHAFDAADKTGMCSSVSTAPAADPELAAWLACKTAAVTLAARQKDSDDAKARLDKVLGLNGASLVSTTSAATGVGGTSNGGGGEAINAVALIAVAGAVKDIANAPGIDETLMFCIAYLGRQSDQQNQTVIDGCVPILAERGRMANERVASFWSAVGQTPAEAAITAAYPAFRSALVAKIRADADATITAKIKKFDGAAHIVSVGPTRCTTVAACITAVDDGGDIYAILYLTHQTDMAAALAAW